MRERVALVGGTMEIESGAGQGTTVLVRVPLGPDGKVSHVDKLRILLTDDHAVVREGLKALVNAQADMEVVGEAGDGRSAPAAGPRGPARRGGRRRLDAGPGRGRDRRAAQAGRARRSRCWPYRSTRTRATSACSWRPGPRATP